MAVTVAAFQAKFPEFADTESALVQDCLDSAQRNVSTTAWGARADDGVYWLAAHLLRVTQNGANAASGPISGHSVGDVSVSYATTATPGDGLAATAYGVQYVALRSMIFAARCL
jgi:hypothetical protein